MRRGPPRRRAAAVSALALLLFAAVGAVLLPASAQTFVVDGHFGEWAHVPLFPGAGATGEGGPSGLTSVQVSAHEQTLFVHGSFDRAVFAGQAPEVLRVFVDSDADRTTGFDMGQLGADLMLEAAGAGGKMTTSSLFEFTPGRNADDWNGWKDAGRAPFAFDGSGFEAQVLPVRNPGAAAVLVAMSDSAADSVARVPAAAGGVLVAALTPQAGEVVRGATSAVPFYSVRLDAVGADQQLESLAFSAVGGADLGAVVSVILRTGDGSPDRVAELAGGKASFSFDPPLNLRFGSPWTGSLDVQFAEGYAGQQGRSFGLAIAVAEGPNVLLADEPGPPAYLGFVSPLPAVDGAFGEWALAGAQEEATDASVGAGLDIVGTRAMWQGEAGAFYAETRGATLVGTPLADLPARARPTDPAPAPATPAPATPSNTITPPLPPLTANDRLLVYIDSDRDPTTGYRPVFDFPVGAEYVVQVGGRFSRVADAQLLAYAGDGATESAWVPRGDIAAIARGASLEGEIPPEAVFATEGARIYFQTVDGASKVADGSQSLQEVEAKGLNADGLLHFKVATYDPTKGLPPVRTGLLTDQPNGFWVVQFDADAPVTAAAAVEKLGATLFGYVHSNGVVAKMSAGVAQVARSVDGVRWVGIYQPAFKFPSDPVSWPAGPLLLSAILFERAPDLAMDVEAAGGVLLSATSRAARIAIEGSSAGLLGQIPELQYVEIENTPAAMNDIGRNYQGVNLTFVHLGINGSGIIVGISDSGLDFTHPGFDDTGTSAPNFNGRVVGYFRYGSAYGDLNGHGTHTAGSIVGDGDLSNTSSFTGILSYQFRGMAPGAKLVVTALLAGGGSTPSEDQVFADQEAYGATVSSNSWGWVNQQQVGIADYDSHAYITDVSVIDSNTSKAGLQPMTIVFAAGNDGSGADTVGTPGTAKNTITVGASESDRGYNSYADDPNSIAVFSSRGPTDDSRIKPDVVAIGTYVLSTQSRTSGCSCTYGGWDQAVTGANYAFSSGTSQATPQVAGMVAMIQQHINDTYSRIPSPALVKAALINGAQDLGYGYQFTGGTTGPMSQGWGRVNVSRSIEGPPGGKIIYIEEGPALNQGDVVVHRFAISNSSTPLKVTLVWTDTPGNPADSVSLAELVNDLNLVVRAPNGTAYHGNQFQGAWSIPGAGGYDVRNNVENVFVQSPGVGTWTVEVVGNVTKTPNQLFAMAVSGNLTEVLPPAVAAESLFPGAAAASLFGWNVTTGSINGDSYTDIAVGAPGYNGGNGAVYIFFGGASKGASDLTVENASVVLTGGTGEGFGWDLDASADWDNDGTPDLLVGAPGAGKAYLFLGTSDWSSPSADITFTGAAADRFGQSVSLVGGLDTTSGAEAAIGAPRAASLAGRVYVFSGGSTSGNLGTGNATATFTGAAAGSLFGSAVSWGDMDDDTDGDLAIGAPGSSTASVVLGGVGGGSLSISANYSGIPGTRFGHAVSLEGDLNGDGFFDLLVGAPLANLSAGAAYAFFGNSTPSNDQVIRYYFADDMENGASKWVEMVGGSDSASAWSITSNQYFPHGFPGNSWQDSSGQYANSVDLSIRMASSISLSGAVAPILTFYYLADLEGTQTNFDGFIVEYSTNSGSSWTQLDSTNSQGNYDTTVYNAGSPSSRSALAGKYAFLYDTPGWSRVEFNLSSLSGPANLMFRFRFASDGGVVADGVYIDDVEVRERNPSSPDLAAYGNAYKDQFGTSVSAFPSASGVTGVWDFAVGAPYADSGLVQDAGVAYVFSGSSALGGTTTASSANATVQGAAAASGAGWSTHGLAGFNNSAATRIFVGAPLGGSNQGGALVGDLSSAIPELSDIAAVSVAVAIVVFVRRRRR